MLNVLSTDRAWEKMARCEPFWSVATWEKFRKQNLTPENIKEFFQTGEEYVDRLFHTIREKIDPEFAPKRSLDFGCGVGRVLIPIANRSEQAVGIDVSDTMLTEARRQLDHAGINNVQLIKGDDALSRVAGAFDFIHSVIVFQHIPVRRGEAIFAELLKRMGNRSVGAIHFTYSKGFEPARANFGLRVRRLWKRFRDGISLLRGNPVMQMNDYSLNVLFRMLQDHGINRMHVTFHDHDKYYGVILMFQHRNNDHAAL